MTRKDYEAIAAVLRGNKPSDNLDGDLATWRRIVESFALQFTSSNPRFSSIKFFAACKFEVSP